MENGNEWTDEQRQQAAAAQKIYNREQIVRSGISRVKNIIVCKKETGGGMGELERERERKQTTAKKEEMTSEAKEGENWYLSVSYAISFSIMLSLNRKTFYWLRREQPNDWLDPHNAFFFSFLLCVSCSRSIGTV